MVEKCLNKGILLLVNGDFKMNALNDACLLTDVTMPSGLSFWPKQVGRLSSQSGVHFELGNYTCPHIIEKGHGWVKTISGIQEVVPGDMFCIMNDGQIEYYDDPEDPWCYYWIHFDGKAADELVRSWGFSPDAPWIHPNAPEKVIDSFKNILSMAKATKELRPNVLAAELFRLADAICNPEPYQKSRSKQIIDRAKAIIESQLHSALNITELAALLNIDRTTLFHAFRKECNCSPIEYLRGKRIERACSILENGNRTLSDVARICGFSNDKYFIKTFRQLKGTSPRKFFNNTTK